MVKKIVWNVWRSCPSLGSSLEHSQCTVSYPSYGNSLVVQWLGLRAFTAKVSASILDQGTKIPQTMAKRKKKKKKPFYICLCGTVDGGPGTRGRLNAVSVICFECCVRGSLEMINLSHANNCCFLGYMVFQLHFYSNHFMPGPDLVAVLGIYIC